MPFIRCSNTELLTILDALPIAVLVVGETGEIVLSNFKTQELLGFSEKEMCHMSVNDLVPIPQIEQHNRLVENYMLNPVKRSMDDGKILSVRMKNGEELLVQLGLTPLNIGGKNLVMVSMIETVNQILKVASYNDPLTGLPNRILFKKLSENLRNLAIRNATSLALLFVDLDNFKQVNDCLGHDEGDRVLLEVSRIFSHNIRKNDVIGRIGGDEFVICFYGIGESGLLETIANKLTKSISSITRIGQNGINIGASIGIVCTNSPASVTLDEMIEKADKLMYQAKQTGSGNVFFQQD